MMDREVSDGHSRRSDASAHAQLPAATLNGGESESGRAARPSVALIVATAVLYLARGILIPLAVASILALVFSPIVNRLEHFAGRLVSALLLVTVALTGIILLGYFLTFELTSVAVEMT